MDKSNCLYRGNCKKEEVDGRCPQYCMRFEEMNFLIEKSRLPKRYQTVNKLAPTESDIEAFTQLAHIRENILDFVQRGNNVYLWSETCGNGKTSWSCKLLLQYFDTVWIGNSYRPRGLFINVNSFMMDLKMSFNKQNDEVDDILALLPEVDLVVFDDFLAARQSQYDTEMLLNIVDRRIANGKSCIFTSNVSPNKLKELAGARLSSRINSSCTEIIHLVGGDNR